VTYDAENVTFLKNFFAVLYVLLITCRY